MKHFTILAVALVSLAIAGCVTPGGQPLTPAQYVQLACGFSAPIAEITALMKSDPTIASIQAAGNIICQNIPKSVARGGQAESTIMMRINGQVVHLKR